MLAGQTGTEARFVPVSVPMPASVSRAAARCVRFGDGHGDGDGEELEWQNCQGAGPGTGWAPDDLAADGPVGLDIGCLPPVMLSEARRRRDESKHLLGYHVSHCCTLTREDG